MSGMKEIREHIESVRSTQKVTNAMYLIASTKMRRAREDLAKTRPFFDALSGEIEHIFQCAEELHSPYYFEGDADDDSQAGTYAYIVITADRGLAGAYNQNVIQETLRRLRRHPDSRLFVVGDNGRQYFAAHGIGVERSFSYTAQNPSLPRARAAAAMLLDLYDRREISKIFVIYTDFASGIEMNVRTVRLLPLESGHFSSGKDAQPAKHIRFEPSAEAVLASVVPAYMAGFLYAAVVDSFCAEQNARAAAMDAANQNEEDLLRELTLACNHERQGDITQEITEISAGAHSRKHTGKGVQHHAHG